MLRHARASIAMLGVLAVADLRPTPPPKETLLGACAEKIAAFVSFVANSGTYALKDTSLIIRPIVARVPDFMAGGTATLAYRIRGDSLWLTQRFPWARDTTKTAEFRTTLLRLE